MEDNISTTLNEQLLQQNFGNENNPEAQLLAGQEIAKAYTQTENAVAVLSDTYLIKLYLLRKYGCHIRAYKRKFGNIFYMGKRCTRENSSG